MNNYKLIKLEQGYIIVSDDENYRIEQNEQCYTKNGLTIMLQDCGTFSNKHIQKIIASTFISELPNIDFNGLEEWFGIVNIEKLAHEFFASEREEKHKKALEEGKDNGMYEKFNDELENNTGLFYHANKTFAPIYQAGFNKCLELNKDKLYTEEDLLKAIEMAQSMYWDIDNKGFSSDIEGDWSFKYDEKEIVESIQSKTEWDIEVFIEENKVKINKIL